jgi:MFS family permease
MRWYVVAIFAVLYVISFVDRLILTLLIGPLKADLGISDTQVGLLIGTAFALLYACLGVPVAWLVDRGNRTRIAAAGILVWSLATVASGFVHDYAQLLPLRMCLALGEAVLSPVYVSLVVDHFKRPERTLPMAIFGASGITGVTVAYAIGGGIVDLFESGTFRAWPIIGDLAIWRATLVLVGLPGIFLALLLVLTTRDPPRSVAPSPAGRPASRIGGGLFPTVGEMIRFYFPFLIGSAFLQTIIYATLTWYPTHLVRTFGVPISVSGYLFSLSLSLGAVITLTYPILVRQMTRRGRPDIMLPAQLIILPIGGIIYAAALMMPTVGSSTALMVLGLGLMIGISSMPSIMVGMTAPPAYSARILATNVACQNLIGLAVGPPMVAILAERFFPGDQRALATAMICVLAVAMPICWLLIFASWRPYRDATRAPADLPPAALARALAGE